MTTNCEEILDSLRRNGELSPPSDEWPTSIYHYTSEASLSSILNSGSLWATSPSFLNDSTDSDHHMAVVRRILHKRFRVGPDFQQTARRKAQDFRERFFVSSFCSIGDELSLWRAYGDNTRGFALAVNPKLLSEAPMTDGLALTYLPMRYLDELGCERQFKEREEEGLQAVGAASPTCVETEMPFHLLLQGQIDSMSIKHAAFSHECEHRMLLMETSKQCSAPRDRRLQGRRAPLYRRIPLPHDAVTEIVVGPGRDFESSKEQLVTMLKHYGFDPDKIKITKSTIPWA